MITIGIDPHKSSLTAVALQPSGETASTIRLEVNSNTVDRLLAWAIRWTQRQWAVEGAAGLGHGVAQGLAGAGEPVLDVPAQLAARARLLNTGHARKTDPIDAAAVAMVAQHHRRLHPVRAEGHSVVLRLLSERRDDLAEERTRTANRLHALLRDLIAGGAKRNLTAEQAAALLRTVRPVTAADEQRKALCRELVADLRRLDTALRRNGEDIATAVAAHGTSVTQIHGIGRSWRRRSSGTPARSSGSRPATTSPVTAAPRRSRPLAASSADTGSPGPGTVSSTAPCTWSRSVRSAPAVRGGSTTSANSARPRPRRRHVGRSNAGCATPSTATSSEINKQLLDIQRRCVVKSDWMIVSEVRPGRL